MNPGPELREVLKQRNAYIVSLRQQGMKLVDIGHLYGITQERVRQIVKRHERFEARVKRHVERLKELRAGGAE